MKIKTDFVTNSSSIVFLIIDNGDPPVDIQTFLWEKGARKKDIEKYAFFKTIEQIEIYNNNGRPLDWVTKITGPRYHRIGEDFYDEGRDLIRKGNCLHYLKLNNNAWEAVDILKEHEQLDVAKVENW